ncbi:MAG: GTPase HflX, partial [Staphylothermus sp.]|nr:GTPase HflX [Staphylothermus sp.]
IIHIVDFSKDINQVIKELVETRKILEKIGIHGKPTILALNKIDLVDNIDEKINIILEHLDNNEVVIPISAIKKTNIEKLLWYIKQIIAGNNIDKNICAKIWT